MYMNRHDMSVKINSSLYMQLQKNGVATRIQVFLDLGILSKEDVERWRFGKVDYLERVCKANLGTLSFIAKEIRAYGHKHKLKESFTYYKQWGLKDKNVKKKLRFSKSGNPNIEKEYATHYVKSNDEKQKMKQERELLSN